RFSRDWSSDVCSSDLASAKQLYGKDIEDGERIEGDFMRGAGTHDPSKNPNAYPMTDEDRFPSAVTVYFEGRTAGTFELPDDPARSEERRVGKEEDYRE